jgi:hypothetical protein
MSRARLAVWATGAGLAVLLLTGAEVRAQAIWQAELMRT